MEINMKVNVSISTPKAKPTTKEDKDLEAAKLVRATSKYMMNQGNNKKPKGGSALYVRLSDRVVTLKAIGGKIRIEHTDPDNKYAKDNKVFADSKAGYAEAVAYFLKFAAKQKPTAPKISAPTTTKTGTPPAVKKVMRKPAGRHFRK